MIFHLNFAKQRGFSGRTAWTLEPRSEERTVDNQAPGALICESIPIAFELCSKAVMPTRDIDWTYLVQRVNQDKSTVFIREDEFESLRDDDLQMMFARYHDVTYEGVVEFNVRSLRGRKVGTGPVQEKRQRIVFACDPVPEDVLALCSTCRLYVGVLGSRCGMRGCDSTDATHDVPLVSVPQTT